ncbi:MAG: DUF3685 domain-containing protein [Geitlerinemataceae cyanobacterium]
MTETSAPALVVAIVDRDRIFSLGLQAWVSQRLGQGRTVTVEIFDRAAPLLQEIDTEALSVGLAIVGDLPAVEPACQALSERRVPVLVAVETLTSARREQLIALGARGAFRKSLDAEQILAAMTRVLVGETSWGRADAAIDLDRLVGLDYIDAAISRLDRRLERAGLSRVERLFLQGQRREARAARWIARRLGFSPSPVPSETENATPIPPERAIVPVTTAALTTPTEVRATCVDRVLVQLQSSTTNLSNRPLEIDILSEDKRRELLAIVLRRFDETLSKATLEDASVEALYDNHRRILADVWSETAATFFGYYRTASIDGETIAIVDRILERRTFAKKTVLDRIPFFPELLAYFVCGAPLVVDNATYTADTTEALYRGQMLLENAIVHVANAIVQPLLECFGDVEAIKRDFYDRRLLTTREIERFRNDLSWKYRWQLYISDPVAIYESRHQIYVLGERGIRYVSIYAPRRREIASLSSLQQAVTLVLEGRDALAPRVRRIVSVVGTGLVYVLTQVVGRGLGLVGRGILDGIGNARLDRGGRTDRPRGGD